MIKFSSFILLLSFCFIYTLLEWSFYKILYDSILKKDKQIIKSNQFNELLFDFRTNFFVSLIARLQFLLILYNIFLYYLYLNHQFVIESYHNIIGISFILVFAGFCGDITMEAYDVMSIVIYLKINPLVRLFYKFITFICDKFIVNLYIKNNKNIDNNSINKE